MFMLYNKQPGCRESLQGHGHSHSHSHIRIFYLID